MNIEVCHLINTIERGGAQTLVRDIVKNAPEDVSFEICALEERGSMDTAFDDVSADVVSLEAERKLDPGLPLRLGRYLKTVNPDVLHAHLPYAQVQGRIVGSILDIPAIVSTQHNVPGAYNPVSRILEYLTRPACDRIVTVSAGVSEAFGKESRACDRAEYRKWCTIRNGLDIEMVDQGLSGATPDSVTPPPSEDGPVYLAVGRYVPEKDQRTLIEAMTHVVDDHSDATLYVVGGGPLESDLENEIRERNLTDVVHLTGYVPDIYAYYTAADVFVSSSRREGLPITVLEAMAARLPVVATTVPGVEEVVVDGGTGRLVPPGHPRELGDAITEVTGHTEPLGDAGRKRILDSFTVEQTVRSYLRLYQRLLA